MTKIEQKAVLGYENKLLKLNLDEKNFKNKVGAIIIKYLSMYGGSLGNTKSESDFILLGCIESVQDKWMHFGLEDIEAAFEMWGDGEIGDNNTTMYKGLFNVMIFNKLLNFYEKRRAAIINEFNDAINTKNKKEIEEQIKQYNKEWAEKYSNEEIIEDIKKYLSKKSVYSNIPYYLAKLIFTRKIIKLSSEEIESYKEKALILAKKEAENENKGIPTKLIGKTNKELTENLEDRSRIIAYQISVFEKINEL